MKILIVSPVPTHPATSGNTARILQLSEALRRQGHEVWFLHADFQSGDPAAMAAYWGERYVAHRYQRPWKKHRLVLGGLPIPDRWHGQFVGLGWAYQSVDHLYDPALGAAARRLQAEHHFEAVIAEYVFCSKVLEEFPDSVRKLVDTHDVYSGRHDLFRANAQPAEWFFTIRGEERKGLLRAHCVIAIQEHEKQFFARLLGGRREVVTIGHLIDATPLPAPRCLRRILYVGSANSLNLRAMQEFLSTAWPRVRAQAPEMTLQIAGGVCAHLVAQEGVALLGILDSLTDAYAQADLVINPISFGTGLKIKTLEALAFARPLVTTPCGAEGLEAGAGSAFLVAPPGAPFADALLALRAQPEKALALGQEAAHFVSQYRARQEETLQQCLLGLASGRKSPR